MNIAELRNFQLTKAIDFNTDLNPQLFMMGDKMRPEVRSKLMHIADHFREFLGVQDIALVDIEVSGSNAAYSYTPHSDVDLHLIVDFSQLPDSDIYRELFNAKQYQYNDSHDIKIKGYDVELYVQDVAQPHHSLGSYSVLTDTWNRIPTKQRANLNDQATHAKYQKLKNLSIRALASDNEQYLNDVLDMVKKYRQAGLDKHGEFGPENLAFKMLRTDGYFEKLWAKKRSHTDQSLSLETKVEEPDTLAQELMAEFISGTTPEKTEGMIKRMYGARDSLFDDFDYDYIQEAAGKLVTLEAAYSGNLGFMEVMQFYKIASKDMVDLLKRLIDANKTKEAWALVQKITNSELVGKEFTEGVLKTAAEHLLTSVTNVNIVMKQEPISEFKEEIGRALSIIDQHPDAIAARDKIITEIKAGGEIMPMYYGLTKNTQYDAGTGLFQLLAYNALGIKTVPSAYISKKSIVEDTKQFEADKAIFTTVDSDGNECYDMFSHDYHQIMKEHTMFYGRQPLTEDIDLTTKKKVLSFYNSIDTSPPEVGDKVFVLELMYINPMGVDTIVQKGELSGSEVIRIETKQLGDQPYTLYTIKTPQGRVAGYPSEFESANQIAKTFFFNSLDELQKVRTVLGISFSNWRFANQLNEDGRIVNGVNTTQDVGVDEIKIQAKKMGFIVNTGGIPPIPKNGVPKLYEGVLTELNMAPGRLQKEVNRIIQSVNPMIGVEFEVIIPRDTEGNPDITKYTTYDDLKEFFSESDDEAFWDLENRYQDWLSDKQGEWSDAQALETLNNPNEESSKKIEFMVDDYVMSGDADEIVARITDDENDTEITEDMVDETLARADQIYKANGPADEWPSPSEGADPFIRLYYEIFVEDNDEALEYFTEFFSNDFYNSEMQINDNEYSVGRWLMTNHINSMGDVFREFEDTLYWPGGAMYRGDFDETTAQEVAYEIGELVGEEIDVAGDESYGDIDTSKNWIVTSDASIKVSDDGKNDEDAGLEIVTAKMDYLDGIEKITSVFDYLNEKEAYTNSTTALHINISLDNVDHSKLNYPKLVVMLGDTHVLKQYGREFNEYAQNALTSLADMMSSSTGYTKDKEATAKSYAEMMGKLTGDFNNAVASSFGKVDFGKFSSVGIKDNYIEFRAVGGEDYLDDVDDIINMINRFVISYVVACDPEAYKKEYGKKLYKLASNVGNGQVPTTSMALFAKFGAGMITKEDLIRLIKAKKDEKAKAKEIDTGDATSLEFHELDSEGAAMMQIAWKHKIEVANVKQLWKKGLEIETSKMPPAREPEKTVYDNLIKDIRHYNR